MLSKAQLIILWIMGVIISLAFIRSGIIIGIYRLSILMEKSHNFAGWTIYYPSMAINWVRVLAVPTLIIGSLLIVTLWRKDRKNYEQSKN